jgi:hypothetical protein
MREYKISSNISINMVIPVKRTRLSEEDIDMLSSGFTAREVKEF